jgi:PEP-CTERM motif
MILESAENAIGSASVTLIVGSFPGIFRQMANFLLLDGDSGCSNPGCTNVSDRIDVLAASTGLQVTMCSGACPATIGFTQPQVLSESGQPQDIDVLPSPIGSGNLHVIVDSIDAVPEPSTFTLLAAGLGVLSVIRRRRTA